MHFCWSKNLFSLMYMCVCVCVCVCVRERERERKEFKILIIRLLNLTLWTPLLNAFFFLISISLFFTLNNYEQEFHWNRYITLFTDNR